MIPLSNMDLGDESGKPGKEGHGTALVETYDHDAFCVFRLKTESREQRAESREQRDRDRKEV